MSQKPCLMHPSRRVLIAVQHMLFPLSVTLHCLGVPFRLCPGRRWRLGSSIETSSLLLSYEGGQAISPRETLINPWLGPRATHLISDPPFDTVSDYYLVCLFEVLGWALTTRSLCDLQPAWLWSVAAWTDLHPPGGIIAENGGYSRQSLLNPTLLGGRMAAGFLNSKRHDYLGAVVYSIVTTKRGSGWLWLYFYGCHIALTYANENRCTCVNTEPHLPNAKELVDQSTSLSTYKLFLSNMVSWDKKLLSNLLSQLRRTRPFNSSILCHTRKPPQ